jgi:hypothetical protein
VKLLFEPLLPATQRSKVMPKQFQVPSRWPPKCVIIHRLIWCKGDANSAHPASKIAEAQVAKWSVWNGHLHFQKPSWSHRRNSFGPR